MTQCIVELLQIFEALEELLFSLQCLSLFVWGFFPEDKVDNTKTKPLLETRKSNQKPQVSVISCDLSWSFWKLFLVSSLREGGFASPWLGKNQTPQVVSTHLTSVGSPGLMLLLCLGRAAQVCSTIVHQIFHCFISHDVCPFLFCFLSLRLFELLWILILILKVGFLMFFFRDSFWSILGLMDWCLVWWKKLFQADKLRKWFSH